MHLPQSKQESSPLENKASLAKPGMYLIALRTHLGRGKAMIGHVINTVAKSLPKPEKLPQPDDVLGA